MRPCGLAGFTLLELSVVLVIIAVIAAMAAHTGSSVMNSVQITSTTSKLDQIEQALMAFRTINNRLPCPADASLARTNTGYGLEAANPGACTGGSPAANFSDATNAVVQGAIPFKTLNLPEEYMYDNWGRKFAYALNWHVTALQAMLDQTLADSGNITINDGSGNARSTKALYALVSFGPNGHGGYLSTGARKNAGSTNTDELTNCHCDSSANATAYAASYVQKDSSQNPSPTLTSFDDIVRYKERWQMQTYDDSQALVRGMVDVLGLRIDGIDHSDFLLGLTSVVIGDINGDGIPDLIISAPRENNHKGVVYVIFGTKSGFPNPLPLSSLNGTNGFILYGDPAGGTFGSGLATGDINGDGIADLIIGCQGCAFAGGITTGSVYVVYGNKGPWSASYTVTSAGSLINGTNGFRLDESASGNQMAGPIATADINGDGLADIIVGESQASYDTNSLTGSVYVIFGGPGPKSGGSWAATQTLTPAWLSNNVCGGGVATCSSPAINGFRLDGDLTNDRIGNALATGDINGDGMMDIIIGDSYKTNSGNMTGSTYVIFGGASPISGGSWPTTQILTPVWLSNNVCGVGVDPCSSPAVNGFRLDGVTANDQMGFSVSAGDVNGDGKTDILTGASNASYNGSISGSTYIVFGGPKTASGSSWAATQTVTTNWLSNTVCAGADPCNSPAVNGFRLDGSAASNDLGWGVASVDFNHDGTTDIILGSPNTSYGGAANAGSTYILFGGPMPTSGGTWPTTQALTTSFLSNGSCNTNTCASTVSAVNGFRLDATTSGEVAGRWISAGDLNGDGSPDLAIVAPRAAYGGANSGSVYVTFGRPPNAIWPATSTLPIN